MVELLMWLEPIGFFAIVVCCVCFYVLYLKLRDAYDSLWSEIINMKWDYISREEYKKHSTARYGDFLKYQLEPLKEDINKQKMLLENLESKMDTNDRLNYARSNRETVIVDAIDAIADYMNIEFFKKEGGKPIVRKRQSNKTKNKNGKHTVNNRRIKK